MESLSYNGLNLNVWDVGGQTFLRPYWKTYYPNTDCVVVVVDSADAKRFEIVKREIEFLGNQTELQNIPFCIMANKQDLKQALSDKEVIY